MKVGEIFIGDAMRGLDLLEPASVHAVVTDPPYSSGGAFRGDRAQSTDKKYTATDAARRFKDFDGDTRDQHAFVAWLSILLAQARTATVPGGIVATFCDWRQLAATIDVIQIAGWVFRGVAPWVKPSCRPQLGRPAAQCEFVVWGSNGARPIEGEAHAGYWLVSSPKDRAHPTQKPLDLMRKLVRLAPPGGVVLDPFLGSGTTAVAAVLEGRRWAGAESNPHYADIARRRIAEVTPPAAPDVGADLESADLDLDLDLDLSVA